jgi:hypothetical protein
VAALDPRADLARDGQRWMGRAAAGRPSVWRGPCWPDQAAIVAQIPSPEDEPREESRVTMASFHHRQQEKRSASNRSPHTPGECYATQDDGAATCFGHTASNRATAPELLQRADRRALVSISAAAITHSAVPSRPGAGRRRFHTARVIAKRKGRPRVRALRAQRDRRRPPRRPAVATSDAAARAAARARRTRTCRTPTASAPMRPGAASKSGHRSLGIPPANPQPPSRKRRQKGDGGRKMPPALRSDRAAATKKALFCRAASNGETRTRTGDTTIFSRVLYQLSYLAVMGS